MAPASAQIVIAWTLPQPGITFALCGARNPEQAIENARAGTHPRSTRPISPPSTRAHQLALS